METNDIITHNLTTQDLMNGIVAIKAQEVIMGRMGRRPQSQVMAEYNEYLIDLQKEMSVGEKEQTEYANFMLSIDSEVEKVLAKLKKL